MSANLSRPATSNGPAASGSTAPSPSSVSPTHPSISPRSRHSAHRHSHSHSYSTPSTTSPGQPPYPHSPYIGTGSTLSSTALAVEHTPGPGQCFCSTCHLKTRVFPRRQDGKIVLPSPWLVSQMARPGRPEDVDRQRLEQQQQGTTHAYRRRAMTAVSMGGSAAGSQLTSANGASYLHGDASRGVQESEDDPDKTTVVSRHARIGSSRSRTASIPKPYDVAIPHKRSDSATFQETSRLGRQSSRSVSQVGSAHVVSGSFQGYYPTGKLSGSRDSLPSTPSSATGDATASQHGPRGPTSRDTNYTPSTNPRLSTSTVMRYNSWSDQQGESSSGPSGRPGSTATTSSSPDLANGNRIRFQSPVVPDTTVASTQRSREISIVQVKWESDRKRRQGYFSQDDGPEKSPFRHYNKSECDFDR